MVQKITLSSSPQPLRVPGAGVTLSVLDYRTLCQRTDTPTLLLVHGIRDNAWSLHPVAEKLCQDYPTLALDLRGHGDSESPGAYSFALNVADFLAVSDYLEIAELVFIGHSLGGQLGAHYAALFPERVRALVIAEGLGPLNPPLERESQRRSDRKHTAALNTLLHQQSRLSDLEEAVRRLCRHHPKLSAERARFLALTGTRARPDGGLEWKWDPRIQSIWLTISQETTELRWTQIQPPVLVVTGERGGEYWQQQGHYQTQPKTTDQAEIYRRVHLLPNVKHITLPEVGHMLHYEAPERFAEALHAFLLNTV